jgi:hypothetical protein
MTAAASLRILLEFTWPNDVVTRLWDGAGPFVDGDLNVWRGSELTEGLDAVEQAINGEAYTLTMSLTGVPSSTGDIAFETYSEGNIVGGTVRIMLQECDANDQPTGDPETRFTGTVDNVIFDDAADDGGITSNISVECTNRFTLRRLTSGAVLSDADQRARAAILNPLGTADRFCERVPLMLDKTIVWPRWN